MGAKNNGGKQDRQSSNAQGHDGNKHNKGGKHSQEYHGKNNFYSAISSKKKEQEIVPWGFEQAQKEERKKKNEQAAAAAAAKRAARDFDPAMVVKEKTVKSQPEDFKKGKNTKTAPGGGAAPQA